MLGSLKDNSNIDRFNALNGQQRLARWHGQGSHQSGVAWGRVADTGGDVLRAFLPTVRCLSSPHSWTAHSHTARCLSSPPLTRLTPPCNTCLKTNISARMQMCTRSPFYQSHMPELTAPHHTTPAWRRPAQRCAPTHRRIRSPAHHRIRALEQGCIEH